VCFSCQCSPELGISGPVFRVRITLWGRGGVAVGVEAEEGEGETEGEKSIWPQGTAMILSLRVMVRFILTSLENVGYDTNSSKRERERERDCANTRDL